MQAWKEDFLKQDVQQFRINLEKGNYDEPYVVGASQLPDPRKKYNELSRNQKKVVDQWFRAMLSAHFSILKPGDTTGGDEYLVSDGQRVVEFVLIYGIIGGEFLCPLLSGSN